MTTVADKPGQRARQRGVSLIETMVAAVVLLVGCGATMSLFSVAVAQISSQGDVGTRVTVEGLGLEGTVVEVRGKQAEVDVRGKRMRAALRDLRVISGPSAKATVRVHVDLQPRQGSLSEINVIGCTVDEAVTRVEKFLDESMTGDQQVIRIIHGHGTGQLRRAVAEFLKNHPLVAKYETAPENQGGGGATIVHLKD